MSEKLDLLVSVRRFIQCRLNSQLAQTAQLGLLSASKATEKANSSLQYPCLVGQLQCKTHDVRFIH